MKTTPPNTPPEKKQPTAIVSASAIQSQSDMDSTESDGIALGRKEYPPSDDELSSDDELPSDDEQKQLSPTKPLKKIYILLLLITVALPVLIVLTPRTHWWRDSIKHQQTDAAIGHWASTDLVVYNVKETTVRNHCPYNRKHVWEAVREAIDVEVQFFQEVLSFVGESPAEPPPNTLDTVFKRCAKLVEKDLADNCHVYHPNHGRASIKTDDLCMDRSSNAGVYRFCNKVDTSRQSPRCKFGKCTQMKQCYEKRGYKNGKQNNDIFDEDWDENDEDEDDDENDEDYVWDGEECHAHFMVDWDSLPEDAINIIHTARKDIYNIVKPSDSLIALTVDRAYQHEAETGTSIFLSFVLCSMHSNEKECTLFSGATKSPRIAGVDKSLDLSALETGYQVGELFSHLHSYGDAHEWLHNKRLLQWGIEKTKQDEVVVRDVVIPIIEKAIGGKIAELDFMPIVHTVSWAPNLEGIQIVTVTDMQYDGLFGEGSFEEGRVKNMFVGVPPAETPYDTTFFHDQRAEVRDGHKIEIRNAKKNIGDQKTAEERVRFGLMERNHVAFEDVAYTLDDLLMKLGYEPIYHDDLGITLYAYENDDCQISLNFVHDVFSNAFNSYNMGTRSTHYGEKEYNQQARAILQYTRIQSIMRTISPVKTTTSTKTVANNPIMCFLYRVYLLKNHHIEPVIATAHAKALWYANDDSKQPLSPDFLRRRKQYYNQASHATLKKDGQLRRRVVLCLSTWKIRNSIDVTYKKIAGMLETQVDKRRRQFVKIIRMLSSMTIGQLEEDSTDWKKIHKLVTRRYAEWLASSDREWSYTPGRNADATTVAYFKTALKHFEKPSNWNDGKYNPFSRSENTDLWEYLYKIRSDKSNNNMRRVYFEERGLGAFVNKGEWTELIANKLGYDESKSTIDDIASRRVTAEDFEFSQ